MKRIILSLALLISTSTLMTMQRSEKKSVSLREDMDPNYKPQISRTYSANKIWLESNPPIPQKTAVVLTIGNICKQKVDNIVIGVNEQADLRCPGTRVNDASGSIYVGLSIINKGLKEGNKIAIRNQNEGIITHIPSIPSENIIGIVEPYKSKDQNITPKDEEKLYESYINCLFYLEQQKKSIAFPSLSTSIGYDINKAAPVAIKAVSDYVNAFSEEFRTIKFVVQTKQEWEVYKELLDQEFGSSIEEKK